MNRRHTAPTCALLPGSSRKPHGVSLANLPAGFPTHRHDPHFWESLGRAVATFGFLEQTLGRAIFAITATTEYSEDAVSAAVEKWTGTLKNALTDALGNKVIGYERAVRANAKVDLGNVDLLIEDLKKVGPLRNALCHGSWGVPDADGASVPFFVDRNLRRFETKVDAAYLDQVQSHVLELAVAVVNSVTQMGWQFPGSQGPGVPVWGDPAASTAG